MFIGIKPCHVKKHLYLCKNGLGNSSPNSVISDKNASMAPSRQSLLTSGPVIPLCSLLGHTLPIRPHVGACMCQVGVPRPLPRSRPLLACPLLSPPQHGTGLFLVIIQVSLSVQLPSPSRQSQHSSPACQLYRAGVTLCNVASTSLPDCACLRGGFSLCLQHWRSAGYMAGGQEVGDEPN